jgi:hypothetical protein
MLSITDSWIKACTFQDTCTDENAAYLQKTLTNIQGDVRCVPAVGPEDQPTNTTTAATPSATFAAPVTVKPTPTPAGNGGTHLPASSSKFIAAGAAFAVGSTILIL